LAPSRVAPTRVALTGGIGSGKSTVAGMLILRGLTVIDSDAIVRGLTGAGGAACAAISQHFGAEYLSSDGSVDRAHLRALVFHDAAARAGLEALLHPMVRDEALAQERARRVPGRPVVCDIPLFAETPAGRLPGPFDRVVVVDCPAALQAERALARGTMGEDEVRASIAAQAPRAQRLALATDVLFNGSSREALARGVERLLADWQGPAV
jgi:dephospho-CoA kinase